ncbi:MAG: Nif3-like dinuclear metal center hexameric protein [Eubacterium sp.]|nr:Nif3-like dinuclear metal center hexameric protein [Eubacterium sp.]
MTCNEILNKLETEYPADYAEDWDNPGLLAGRRDGTVQTVLVALDATEDVIEQAVRQHADLLITHHPLLFHGIRSVNDQDFIGRRLLTLIENHIACYAIHTNFDVLGMAELNEKQLGLQNARVLDITKETENGTEGIGRIGEMKEPVSLRQMAALVSVKMGVPSVRCYGPDDSDGSAHSVLVRRVAVCGGSGKSMISHALREGADVLVTGDIDYHSAIDALSCGLYIIDAGHYGTEYGFISALAEKLRGWFPGLTVSEAPIRHPYTDISFDPQEGSPK